jgi:hypothetical protein
VRWILSAVALVALAFIAVGIVREQPLGEVQSKELRQFGYVMLVVTAVFALVWVLWEEPGVLT